MKYNFMVILLLFVMVFNCGSSKKKKKDLKNINTKDNQEEEVNNLEKDINFIELIFKINNQLKKSNSYYIITEEFTTGAMSELPSKYLPESIIDKSLVNWVGDSYMLNKTEWNKIIKNINKILTESKYSNSFIDEYNDYALIVKYKNKVKKYSINFSPDIVKNGKINISTWIELE